MACYIKNTTRRGTHFKSVRMPGTCLTVWDSTARIAAEFLEARVAPSGVHAAERAGTAGAFEGGFRALEAGHLGAKGTFTLLGFARVDERYIPGGADQLEHLEAAPRRVRL